MEQRARRKCLMNRVDLVQLGGQVTNPEDPYTAVSNRGCKARHVRQNRLATVSGPNEVASKIGRVLEADSLWQWSCGTRNHNLFWRMLQISARDQHRWSGRVFLTFPWNWNVLTTWPIQSVLTEALFLCAREERKGILTNCVDTARLVGRCRCCKSPISQPSGAVLTRKPVCVT